jgi:hypothetical protein
VGSRGRLAHAVKELLESKRGDKEEENRRASEMADMLMRTGVHGDHRPSSPKAIEKVLGTALMI